MLPEGNQIAESVYEAKKIICPLGIEVEKIHACKNNCVLFCGNYADLDKCPKCGYDRYKRKNDGGDDNNADDENEPGEIRGKKKANRGAPVRVAWYFCIISWLRRWFATRKEAQPVDPEGETLHARVLVHIMMRLDVEGLTNTFKLSEGAPKKLDGELSVVEEWFLVGVLGRRLLPLLQLLPTTAFVVVVLPSSPLRRRWDAISSLSR
jgi:hypothetical protein